MIPARKRAVKGSIHTELSLGLDKELHRLAVRAAKREGVSLTQWIRVAIHERILRAEHPHLVDARAKLQL